MSTLNIGWKKQSITFRVTLLLMPNNALSHKNSEEPATIRFLRTSKGEVAGQFSRLKPNQKLVGHSEVTSLRKWTLIKKRMGHVVSNSECITWNYIGGDPEMFHGPVFDPNHVNERITYSLLTSSTQIFKENLCLLINFDLFHVGYFIYPKHFVYEAIKALFSCLHKF